MDSLTIISTVVADYEELLSKVGGKVESLPVICTPQAQPTTGEVRTYYSIYMIMRRSTALIVYHRQTLKYQQQLYILCV